MGKTLNSCNESFIDNNVSFHVGKTECILFGSKSKLKNIENFEVHYNGQVIKGKKNVKYLGVLIDQVNPCFPIPCLKLTAGLNSSTDTKMV